MKKTNEFLKELEREYGIEIFIREKAIEAYSTGSLSLDVSTGVGGIPKGKVSLLYGAPGSGKTTVCLTTCKSVIEKGDKVLYVDVENMLDFDYAEEVVGIAPNHENFFVVQPNTAEDSLSLAGRGIRSNEFGLVIIDSVGALAPKKEKEEEDFEKADVGLVPKLFSKFLRIYFYFIRINNVAVLVVNQVRANIGAYIKSYTIPGGYALEHASSMTIFLSKESDIKQKVDDNLEVIGINVKFNIKKNKLFPPNKSFNFPVMYGQGIDYYRDLINFAKTIGVIDLAGAYYKFEGENIGQGIVGTIETLHARKELLDKILELCYNKTHSNMSLLENPPEITFEEE